MVVIMFKYNQNGTANLALILTIIIV